MSLAEYNISTPVKRPWNHDTLTAHWSQINLKDALDPAPMRILDVGFGIHQRSTRALATLFPEAKLVAIDNDLRLLNSEKHQQQDGVCYRFGDVDCWLPSSDTEDLFDLIVVCLAAHAFSHPLRGIANLVDLISPNGHLLFVHRTDPVMRAICRLPLQHDNSEAKQIENVWGDLEKMARETQNEDSKWRPIPWRLRLVCEHEPLDYLCHCLGLSRIGSWSSDHSRLPDNQETIANVFGFNSGQPQYQAPFHARSGRWSLDKPEVLNSKIQLSSYLYKQSQTPLRVESLPHVFAPAQSIVPPRIAEINVQDAPLESGRFKQAVWNLLSDTLRGDLKDVPTSESLDDEILVRGAYLVGVDKEQSSRFWGPDQEVKDGDSNMITEAVASSNVLIPGRDRHSFLIFCFPVLKNSSSFSPEWKIPESLMRTLALQTATGEHGAIIQLIPMPTDSSPMELQNYFTKVGLDLTTELAEYIQARGRWARGNENPNSQSPVSPLLEGAALYLFVFRSEAADEGVHPQTVSFLTRCWLEVEGVRNLTDAAHAILSMLEERKVAEAAARAKSAEERAALFDTVRASTEQLVELLTEASEPVQRLSSAFSPFGGLIFGGLRAEKFYPDSPKKVKVNDRLPLIEVQHGWTADWYQSREPRPPLEQTAAVLLTVLGEAPGARMPLWNNLRALFESPPANMGPILNTLRDHLDGLDEALDKRANEFASTGVDAELAEKVFRTTKLWFHDVYKFQSPASIAAPSPKDGLPPSLLKSVFQIHGIDLKISCTEDNEHFWVPSRRVIDTADGLNTLLNRLSVKSAHLKLDGSYPSTTAILTLTLQKPSGLGREELREIASRCKEVQKAEREGRRARRGDTVSAVLQLFGSATPQYTRGPCLKGSRGKTRYRVIGEVVIRLLPKQRNRPEEQLIFTWKMQP